MSRTCSVCTHAQRAEIDKALVAGDPLPKVAALFRVSDDALTRHKANHLPDAMTQSRQSRDELSSIDLVAELQRCMKRVHLLYDACDRWLRDPDNPEQYDIGPRAEDVSVTYSEAGDAGKRTRRKAKLSELLERVNGNGHHVDLLETKYADPRELLLKTANSLNAQHELLGRLVGKLQETQVNILINPEWTTIRGLLLDALRPYPQARASVSEALARIGDGKPGK